jgi:uncharacterized protein (TIGR03083 family)
VPTTPGADIANNILVAYEAFAQMIESLDAKAWQAPTRCTGWSVCDVAGHVVGLATDSASGDPGGRTPDEHAAALRDRSPQDLATQLRASVAGLHAFLEALDETAWSGPSPVPDRTLTEAVAGLWFDTYLHDDDVRAALRIDHERGATLAFAVAVLAETLARRGWGPATLELDGTPPVDVGAGGPKVTGDPYQFVLVASGRADPATMGLDPTVNIYAP